MQTETPAIQDQSATTPRAGERALTPADRIFYAALFCLLVYVLFSVDGGMFQITRVMEATR